MFSPRVPFISTEKSTLAFLSQFLSRCLGPLLNPTAGSWTRLERALRLEKLDRKTHAPRVVEPTTSSGLS